MTNRSPLLLIVALATLCIEPSIAQPNIPRQKDLFRQVFQIPGEYINDHCLIRAGDRWHLYFIQSKISGSWGHASSETTIGHASSEDLLSWQAHSPAITIGPQGSLDAGHVYAPSVIERGGTYYMLYTGNEMSFDAGEHLLLATSDDLFNWTRAGEGAVIRPDSSWASYYPPGYGGGRGGPRSGRDPHLFRDGAVHGTVCYYVARLKADSTRPSEEGEFSCIAAATSVDLVNWVDRGPVLARRTIGYDEFTWGHLESPCVVKFAERYYLFYKSGSGIRYIISESPYDFHDRTEYFLSTAHASEIFEWNGEWYITSCSRDIDDIRHGTSDRTRGLFLAKLRWNGRHPEVVSIDEKTAVAPAAEERGSDPVGGSDILGGSDAAR